MSNLINNLSTTLLEKAPSQRQLRFGETLRHAVAQSLNAQVVKDEILAQAMLTVTRVKVSPDLKNATVFVAPLNQQAGEDKVLKEALKSASGHMKKYIQRSMVMKYMPRLMFQLDATYDKIDKVNHLFNNPRVRRDLAVS